MIKRLRYPLPHGIELTCRVTGEPGRPVLLFLHGYPEAAFAWDNLLTHFSKPEHGGYRCVAPNLRGFADSSSPSELSAYRAKHLVQDVLALIEAESGSAQLAALVAHDWGGAIGLGAVLRSPDRFAKLTLFNTGAFPPPFVPLVACPLRFSVRNSVGQHSPELPSRSGGWFISWLVQRFSCN